MKKFVDEFKAFINRGNVVDLAVGIMIGAAFKAIVDSLVNNIISPLIGLIIRVDFKDFNLELFGVKFGIGAFIMAVINFIIIALVLFLVIKFMNSLHKIRIPGLSKDAEPEPEPEPTTKVCPYCMSTIDIKATRCPHCTSAIEK